MSTPAILGLPFEDFEVGRVVISPARTMTEHDIVAFAGLSGDYNPLHTDAPFAEGTQFGERIAHGLLGLSVASGLAARLGIIDGTALAFLGLDWKFRRPILIGDTVHAEMEVAATRAMPSAGGGVVTFAVKLINQRGEICQRGKWNLLIASGDAGEPDGGSAGNVASKEGAAGDAAGA